MGRVYFGLSSTEGDRLGHLVRGVQMLRSYGKEAGIDWYSDVVEVKMPGEEPPLLACVVGGESEASPGAVERICRETEWALGQEPETLTVVLLAPAGGDPGRPERHAEAFEAIRSGRLAAEMTRVLSAEAFRRLCDWGQQAPGQEGGVIGEWPSATGP